MLLDERKKGERKYAKGGLSYEQILAGKHDGLEGHI